MLSNLTKEAREEALRRFYVLRPFLEEGVPLTKIAQEQGIALRTVQRWVKRYRQSGLAGLARQPRTDRGQFRRIDPKVQRLIEGLALQKPPQTIAFIHRQVLAVAAEQGIDPPSYSTVYLCVRQLDPALVMLAQQGPKAYSEVFELIHRREASKPNEIWQADHTLLNIWLFGDDGRPTRPWLTVILDDYSRAVAGYFVSFQNPCTLHTALTLRQAIWRKDDPRWHICGIPEVFYSDHGSDFTSKHMEQVSADLKMRLVFSLPGQPRGRGRIERFFETVDQLFLCRMPGYSPEGQPPSQPALTLSEFEPQLQEFLLKEYHGRVHGGTGVPPQERWEQSGVLPQLPESLEQLDLLLITVAKTRRIRRDGIHFQGFCYIEPTLADYVGEDVVIRYDPRDMAEIRVYHQNRYICRAICADLAGEKIGLKEIL